LSPSLFALYIDELITTLQRLKLGCHINNCFYGCIVYADDILILAHSFTQMQKMLDVCEEVISSLHMSFNTSKSSFMRCGPRFNKPCGKLLLNGTEIRKSSDMKYLGTCFRAGKKLLFNIDHLKIAFYRTVNAIYSKCCAANSELACVFLLRSMCFPIIHYALESTAPTKTNCKSIDRMIDNCLMKIFATRNELIIKNCRVAFNIPSTTLVYELRE
jgi:hypothetical protein